MTATSFSGGDEDEARDAAPVFAGDGAATTHDSVCGELLAGMDGRYVLVLRSEFAEHVCGPYENAMAAACAAEMELGFNSSLPADEHISVVLAPLLPARDRSAPPGSAT